MALSVGSRKDEILKADYTRRYCCDSFADAGSTPAASILRFAALAALDRSYVWQAIFRSMKQAALWSEVCPSKRATESASVAGA